jgi:hypothetical protein
MIAFTLLTNFIYLDLKVWQREEGPSYGRNSSTAFWITWESEKLREIALKENPGR